MMIEIHEPETVALIRERMQTGAFRDEEDVVAQALKLSRPTPESGRPRTWTGADLVAAMQESPCKEIEIEPERIVMPVRDVIF